MRIALVSPYSWSHPGGVTRHIEALAAEHMAAGHDVRVIAPYDGDPAEAPEWLVSLGPPVGLPFNGAVSNLANTPRAASTLRRALRAGRFDVVHLHEPVAPLTGWMTPARADAPRGPPRRPRPWPTRPSWARSTPTRRACPGTPGRECGGRAAT